MGSASPAELRIGLIGYGEVGSIMAHALREQGAAWVGTWDLLLPDAAKGPAMAAKAQADGIVACDSLAALLDSVTLAISCVTASNTYDVAREAARHVKPGAFFLDLNSASPGTKRRSAAAIDAAGGRYVEAGIMTSVPPYGIKVPMVLGGPAALDLAPRLTALGFAVEVVSPELGVASAIKMCRSIIVKGLEALVIESLTMARRHGVEPRMLESLQETFPGIDWETQGTSFFRRVVKHGRRRAEEMREAARMIQEAGDEPTMAAATAERQAAIARLAAAGLFDDIPPGADWRQYADRIVREMRVSS